jgi:hypothetical protein
MSTVRLHRGAGEGFLNLPNILGSVKRCIRPDEAQETTKRRDIDLLFKGNTQRDETLN